MFVPVIAYDPDLFADFVFVMSQLEISTDSQPSKRVTNEGASAFVQSRTADVLTLAYMSYVWTQIPKQQVSDTATVVLNGSAPTQVQSKFASRSFASKLPDPRTDAPLVSGSFITDQTIEPLFDNIVFRVSVGNLDLSDTKVNNKSVAPVVS